MKLGIVAGEASGDLLGASLIKALRELKPDLTVEGVGGPAMQAAGCHNLYNSERLAVMGFIDPLFRLPELFKIRSNLVNHFVQQNRPDLFIGIDAPDFNLGLELKLREANIPVVHYVSPSVWAWRKNRIHKIAKATNLVLTLLPFEKKFYDDHNVPASFVGHPLADQIPLEIDQAAARAKLDLDINVTYIALLPGSRQGEIKYMGETFLKTAKLCWEKNKNIRFITSSVNEKREQAFKAQWQKIAPGLPIQFFQKSSHEVMAAADVVLVCSGTATLETLLFKRPMVIVYQTGFITYQIAKIVVDVPFFGLPNLLANELLVPEYVQHAAQPERLAADLLDFIDHPEKQRELQVKFTEIHKQLRRNASREAAQAILTIT